MGPGWPRVGGWVGPGMAAGGRLGWARDGRGRAGHGRQVGCLEWINPEPQPMASLPTTTVTFTHATEPGVRITCYSVGTYGEKAGVPDAPIMRCFLSSGAGTGGMMLPMGRYNSERGGLHIMCESADRDSRTCSVGRTGVTPEMPGPISFLTDCATLMPDSVRCIGGEPIETDPRAITDARVSESAMLRDATGTPAGAAQLTGTMSCMRTLVTRPVPITIFASGPAGIAASSDR